MFCKNWARFVFYYVSSFRSQSQITFSQLKFYHRHRSVCRLLNSPVRSFRTNSRLTASQADNGRSSGDTYFESWEYDVEKFGKLIFRSSMDVLVEPVDPQMYPESNKLLIIVKEKESSVKKEHKNISSSTNINSSNNLSKHYSLDVNLEQLPEEILITVGTKEDARKLPLECLVQVPIKYDIELTSEKNGSSLVQKMESSLLKVRSATGDCRCKNIKGAQVTVTTAGGNIVSETVLQGNLKLSAAGKGGIRTDRLQGQSVEVSTDEGEITVKDIYAEQSTFTTECGNVHIQNCHGSNNIQIDHADLNIGTLDGNLTASMKSGTANVFIAREGKVDLLNQKGDVHLKVANSLNSSVSLSAQNIVSSVDIHQCKESKGENGTDVKGNLLAETVKPVGHINVEARKGKITLGYQDWFSSLKLGKGFD